MRIDDAITNYPKATLKSLSKPVAMAFNRLKQTVKKDMKDDAFAAMIEEFRKNPIEEEEEVEEEESESEYSSESESNSESESESESDSSEESSNDYSEEGSSSDESSSSEESSSEESSDEESSNEDDSDDNSSYYSYSSDSFASDSSSSDSEMEVNPKLTGRAKWVLQPKDIEKAKRKEEERLKKLEEKKKKEDEVEVEDTYETPEKLVKALLQVLAARHRVPERRANVLQLQKLLPFARALGPKYELRVLSHLVCLQLAGVNSDAAMPAARWAACLANVTRMVRVMISHQR